MDNALAIDQMEVAYASLLSRSIVAADPSEIGSTVTGGLSKDGKSHPRIITYDFLTRGRICRITGILDLEETTR